MSETAIPGRRERKKAATRKAISDAATRLFLERGYDAVSIREIADAADVSPTTVFAHFPSKEALVFDEEDEQRDMLVAAVRDRAPGTTISQALKDFYRRELLIDDDADGAMRRVFMEFVDRTPDLSEYAQRMWLRYEGALAQAIAQEYGQAEPSEEVRVYARFVLQIQLLVTSSANPLATLDLGFRMLDEGWTAVGPGGRGR